MVETIDILFVLAGLVGGFGIAWFILRGRRRLFEEQVRGERTATARLLQDREQQLAEARESARLLREELDGLLTRFREQGERRAAAEEKCGRIAELEQALDDREKAARALRDENTGLKTRLSGLETRLVEEQKRSEEKLLLLAEARDQLKIEFQNLAQKIFEEKGQKFTEQNRVNLDGVLRPMREQLAEFKKRVEDVYDKESKERLSLLHEIGTLKALNQRISEDAVNLTNALKGQSKTQGAWGEMILERVLEESGLRKGREYESQSGFTGEQGQQLRPDVVVHLPEGKDVVIDSKVSLTAYERFCAAATEEERARQLKLHIASLRAHVKGLSDKNYTGLAGIRSLDFVLLFLPVEGAFLAAVDSDSGLFNDALSKNILLVCPSTLLATLRTIQNIWRYEYQNRNALEIAKKAGDLYDKFVGFVEALEDVGHKIAKARDAYDTAHKRLVSGRGNLIRRARDLERLGVKARKSLPGELVNEAEPDQGPDAGGGNSPADTNS
ncbi:MAG: DNA recombination protein RmuC [Desulfobacterales bacterium]|nr:DNA recombination protein RmuC [Desulfobacterales bacterium]